HCSPHHLLLHPFPTRRSSDLSSPSVRYDAMLCCPGAVSSSRAAFSGDPAPATPDANPPRGKPVSASAGRHISPSSLPAPAAQSRSEEHTSELQSRFDLVCRLL